MAARTRREFAIGGASALALATPARAQTYRARPNIVVIVIDDMRFDEFGAGGHAFLRTPHIDALAASGATFTNAYHTTPLCSPNRACIITGQYASRHGITDNIARSRASHRLRTFAVELQRAGYETAHVGKWHMGNDPTPRPGYDYWVSFEGQGRMIDPRLYEDGALRNALGYMTDLLNERALRFMSRPRTKPFMLFLGHKAIHPDVQQRDDGSIDAAGGMPFIAAERHTGRYRGQTFQRRPNFGFTDTMRANKPIVAAMLTERNDNIATFGAEAEANVRDETIQQRAEMMLSIDEGVGEIVSALEEAGQRQNTLILLMSDNGYFFGEHGLTHERRLPYEEAIKSPLIVSHPGAVAAGSRIDPFALAIDVAPTMVDLAGAEIPARMQGRSLLPLLRGQRGRWREDFLVEYNSNDAPFPWLVNADYRAVRMGQYKYIRWIRHDAEELYDLAADPYEMTNLALAGGHERTLRRARAALARLVVESLALDPLSARRGGRG